MSDVAGVGSELRLTRVAHVDAAKPLRHALAAFMEALEIGRELREDIIIAVGEALANAVEHAYDPEHPGSVELYARTSGHDTLLVDVYDRGRFVRRDEATPGRGLGLRIVRAIARTVSIDVNGGTHVRMEFSADRDGGGDQSLAM
ncbi:MAG TPA: ATP-binding protein [Candidatus Baltobacteraceae bacterium]|nr:ATP-binding protein [Candidatus Baltobacteraceae bacterium]